MTRRAIIISTLAAAAADTLFGSRACEALDLKQQYEPQLIRWALAKTGLVRDPKPAGKRIAKIVIVREDVIAQSDPWPNFVNLFHVKTRDYIVRQELLRSVGDRWNDARVAESDRNLRRLFILAVARSIPCRAAKADEVVWLVVTKDLWSIRLNIIFSQTGKVVKQATFTPTELNFLGRNKQLSLHLRASQFSFEGPVVRDHVALGQRFVDPRILGTRLRLSQSFDAIIDGRVPCGGQLGGSTDVWCPQREAGSLAGIDASLSLSRPLFALATQWAFAVSASIDIRQRRRFVQQNGGQVALDTVDVGEAQVPFVYDGRRYEGSLSFTRRFGDTLKSDVTWGQRVYRFRFSPPTDFAFGKSTLDNYQRDFLPRSETASAFFVTYGLRTTRFVRLRNVQGFALSEDFALGPEVTLSASFAQNLERSAESFVSLSAVAAYRWHLGGDLLTLSASAATRVQPFLDQDGYEGPLANSRLEALARNISPVLGIGRLHTRASLIVRDNDLNNSFSTLGGDTGLRGYANDQFLGRNLMRINVEYRTLPVNVLTLHAGLVAFYDGASVFGDPFGNDAEGFAFRYRHSIGIGFRGHFPQFDRESLRIDMGVPLSTGSGGFGTWVSLSFGQTF